MFLLTLHIEYCPVLIKATSRTYMVGELCLVTLRAKYHPRGGQLPVGTALIATRFGHFSLR